MALLSSDGPRPRRRLTVVAYDIASDHRRARIAQVLQGAGQRVQESVFECYLDEDELRRLRERLARLVQISDSVRFYSLCRVDGRLSRADGCGPKISAGVAFYIA